MTRPEYDPVLTFADAQRIPNPGLTVTTSGVRLASKELTKLLRSSGNAWAILQKAQAIDAESFRATLGFSPFWLFSHPIGSRSGPQKEMYCKLDQ